MPAGCKMYHFRQFLWELPVFLYTGTIAILEETQYNIRKKGKEAGI